MNSTFIYDRLNGIFREVFDDDGLAVTAATTASDVEDWDSFNHIRLVNSVERSFGLRFSAAEVERLKNVGEFVALIQSKAA